MKKTILLVLVLVLCFALPTFAQDKDKMESKPDAQMADKMESAHPEMGPPPALDNELLMSFVGDWEGTSEGPMGISKDKLNYQIGLDGQFLLLQVESKISKGMMKGMGAITMGKNGKLNGFWIDNSRTMAVGAGMIEGNKVTITWTMEGMGKYTRISEKTDDNTFTVMGKMEMTDGSVMESTGTFTRVKDMTQK